MRPVEKTRWYGNWLNCQELGRLANYGRAARVSSTPPSLRIPSNREQKSLLCPKNRRELPSEQKKHARGSWKSPRGSNDGETQLWGTRRLVRIGPGKAPKVLFEQDPVLLGEFPTTVVVHPLHLAGGETTPASTPFSLLEFPHSRWGVLRQARPIISGVFSRIRLPGTDLIGVSWRGVFRLVFA